MHHSAVHSWSSNLNGNFRATLYHQSQLLYIIKFLDSLVTVSRIFLVVFSSRTNRYTALSLLWLVLRLQLNTYRGRRCSSAVQDALKTYTRLWVPFLACIHTLYLHFSCVTHTLIVESSSCEKYFLLFICKTVYDFYTSKVVCLNRNLLKLSLKMLLYHRDWQTFPVKDQIVIILVFFGS